MLRLGCTRSKDNTNKVVVALLDETSIQVLGKHVEDIGSLMNSDSAAIGVSRELDTKDDEFLVHVLVTKLVVLLLVD